MPEPLVIRADASPAIGTGHVMRCLVLAQHWRAAGGAVVFAHASLTPALEARLCEEGFPTVPITAAPGSDDDARLTARLARQHGAAWIVADGYLFGAAWQRVIKATGLRLLAWDDYGHAEHYHADLVLNQNASADARWYAQREPGTRLLLGTRYAALRGEFLAWRDWQRDLPERARKILVTLGGADPDNVTLEVVEALALVPDVEAVIVAGSSNPNLETLRTAIATRAPAMRLVVNATHMAELMAWADVAVAAGGSTSWELAFMGLPTLSIIIAENQAAIARELHRREVSVCLGEHTQLRRETIAAGLSALLADAPRRCAMSGRGRALVDGHGAARVIAALGAPPAITLVSDAGTWLNAWLPELKSAFEAAGHRVRWIHDPAEIGEGAIAFFLSLSRIVPPAALRRHAHNLVVHESALPHGRGWSPLTWQILEGKNNIPVTLFEAVAGLDAGDIYAQRTIQFRGTELVDELRAAQAAATLALCQEFVARYPFVCSEGRPQTGTPSTYARRRPEDSRLDPDKTLREQFNLLRVADPDRYPAFFEIDGRRFHVRLTPVYP